MAVSSATRAFPLDPTSAGQARIWSRVQLHVIVAERSHRPTLFDDVVSVVSELVTNAIRAESQRTVLTLHSDEQAVTVAVTDDVAARPELRTAGPTDESGRGLVIVAALAHDWGVTTWKVGKTVWAELAMSTESASA